MFRQISVDGTLSECTFPVPVVENIITHPLPWTTDVLQPIPIQYQNGNLTRLYSKNQDRVSPSLIFHFGRVKVFLFLNYSLLGTRKVTS